MAGGRGGGCGGLRGRWCNGLGDLMVGHGPSGRAGHTEWQPPLPVCHSARRRPSPGQRTAGRGAEEVDLRRVVGARGRRRVDTRRQQRCPTCPRQAAEHCKLKRGPSVPATLATPVRHPPSHLLEARQVGKGSLAAHVAAARALRQSRQQSRAARRGVVRRPAADCWQSRRTISDATPQAPTPGTQTGVRGQAGRPRSAGARQPQPQPSGPQPPSPQQAAHRDDQPAAPLHVLHQAPVRLGVHRLHLVIVGLRCCRCRCRRGAALLGCGARPDGAGGVDHRAHGRHAGGAARTACRHLLRLGVPLRRRLGRRRDAVILRPK